jgi:hypothetical protein
MTLARLQRKQLFAVLEHALTGLPLKLGNQLLTGVEPLPLFPADRLNGDEQIQGVVPI